MKGIFLRIPEDLDARLTEVCRRQGLKKGGLITRLVTEFLEGQEASDPVLAAERFGIDLSMTRENLKKTPTERLRQAEESLAFVEALRKARHP